MNANDWQSKVQSILEALNKPVIGGVTRQQVAVATGIKLPSVCRWIDALKKEGLVFICGKRYCSGTKRKDEFLTANYKVCLNYFTNLCTDILSNEDGDTQLVLIRAIRTYCISCTLPDTDAMAANVRELWLNNIKPLIDKKNGLCKK